MFGLAQMFSTVSPRMFKEFEVDYASRICERFGLVYYGCCDPLDGKMTQVRQIPNVRKVSMSPWTNQEARRGSRDRRRLCLFTQAQPGHAGLSTALTPKPCAPTSPPPATSASSTTARWN
jgi:hypothetical protein